MEDGVLVSPETTSGDTEQDEFSSIRERFEAGEQLADDEMDKIADLAVGYLKGRRRAPLTSTTVTTGSSSSTSTAATSPSSSVVTAVRSTPCRWSSPPS